MRRFYLRRRCRKAQAETQLNWIFILIAGAVILAFFAFIVVKQRAASEAKFSGKVSQQLNTILVGAKVSSGTVQEISTPDLSIRFTCNDYYIGPASQRLGNKMVFAPEYIEGDRLITWTLDWNVPFKISSFLYMTAPTVRYYLIGKNIDDPSVKSIFDALPQKLNKRVASINDYNDGKVVSENDPYVRFIFVNVGSMFNIPAGFEDSSVSGLSVSTEDSTIQFLERSVADPSAFNTQGGIYNYMEKELLYGAVFSDSSEEFDCLMKRAYERLNIVAQVYYEKFNEIAPMYDSSYCEGSYKDNPRLKELIEATEDYPLAPEDYAAIGSVKQGLDRMNKDLQLKSCPLLY
jgi:hypothetical protein